MEPRPLASSTAAPVDLEDQGTSAATRARAADDLPAAEVSCLDWLSQGWLCLGATCLNSPEGLIPVTPSVVLQQT